MSFITSIRRKFGKLNRFEKAAKQLYEQLVARGTGIEIPATLSKEDDVTNMVLAFREMYGHVAEVTMLQSKSLVVQMKKGSLVTSEAWRVLDAAGYFPGKELPPEMFLAQHEAFMARNNTTREEAEEAALEEKARTTTVTVTGQ